MTRRFLVAAMLALSLAVSSLALAHGGAAAKHGGVAVMASDLSFELVAQPDGAAIYIEDHGKPVGPAGITGKLTVLNGAERTQATLAAAGDRLEARGVRLVPGAKAVATLTTANNKVITVRFSLK